MIQLSAIRFSHWAMTDKTKSTINPKNMLKEGLRREAVEMEELPEEEAPSKGPSENTSKKKKGRRRK